jgi:hypothetical protein
LSPRPWQETKSRLKRTPAELAYRSLFPGHSCPRVFQQNQIINLTPSGLAVMMETHRTTTGRGFRGTCYFASSAGVPPRSRRTTRNSLSELAEEEAELADTQDNI